MLNLKKLFFAAVALSLCFLSPVAKADMNAQGRFSTTVPCNPLMMYLINTNLPLISIRINDTVTATFLVDTGSNFLAVTDSFAKKFNLPLDASNQGGYPNKINGQPLHTTTLAKMEIGKIVIKKQAVVVLPPKKLSAMENSVDGVLGSAFLSKVAVLWNFPQHKLTFLIPGDLKASDLQTLGFNAAEAIPITQTVDNKWTTQACFSNSLQNVNDTLMIDTGSVTTSLSPLLSYSLKLKPERRNVPIWSFNGWREVNSAQVDNIEIGPVSLSHVLIDYNSSAGDLAPPALGMDVLSRFSVLMDFPAGKMYWQAATPPLIPTITIAPQTTSPAQTSTPSSQP